MANHRHEGFSMLPHTVTGSGPASQGDPTDPTDSTSEIDTDLIGRLVGAAYDGCKRCVNKALDQLVTDPPTTARLIQIAGRAVRSQLDGLPAGAVEATTPKPETAGLRCIITELRPHRHGLDDAIAQMDAAARRSAAATALDIIVGDLTTGGTLDNASRPNPRATPW